MQKTSAGMLLASCLDTLQLPILAGGLVARRSELAHHLPIADVSQNLKRATIDIL